MKRRFLFAVGISLAVPMLLANVWALEPADMVLYNGQVLTAATENPFDFPIARAIALREGKILAVGDNEQMLALAGPSTQRVDLKGKTLIPGLIDTHSHIDSYAIQHFGGRLEEAPYFWLVGTSWETKAKGLAEVEAIVKRAKPGQWLVLTRGDMEGLPVLFTEVTRFDLDKVAPSNPVYIQVGAQQNHQVVNSLALKKLLERYPQGLPGLARDQKGNPTGFIKGVAAGAMFHEIVPKPPADVLAPIYKQEMDEWVAGGTTTVSTRLPSHSISSYNLLEQRGEMPLRIGYNPEIVDNHHDPESVLSRLGNILAMGTDRLWVTGVSTVNIDGIPGWGAACISKAYPRESKYAPLLRYQLYGPHGECKLSEPDVFGDKQAILSANKFGLRVANMHVAGDRALDEFLDLLEEANKERPVAGRRFAVDHCQFVTDEHVKKAKRLGVMFSCAPKYVYGGVRGPLGPYSEIYGEKVAADVVVPARRLIDSGLRTVMEVDDHRMSPLQNIEVLVTRRDQDGRVWGEQQRIDRREALYMYTRWAAEYVLKEKVLGSIEMGKWADLVVLDSDYLQVPEERISDMKVLLTVVEGKIVYTAPTLAEEEGLPHVGYRK